MYLLPKVKKLNLKQGIYEICWNTVITIDEKMQDNGNKYAAILQACIQSQTGIECAIIK